MFNKKTIKIFAGTSHPALAGSIANDLGLKLAKMEIKKFASNEIYCRSLESVRGCEVYVVQTATDDVNEDMMELFIMLDAFKRSFATGVHVVMPHYAYSRQDRVAAPREPISARLMADLISTAGATHLITLSLHSGQTQGFFSFSVDNIHTHMLFINYFKKKFSSKQLRNVVVVATDAGGVKQAKRVADPLGLDIAVVNKVRPTHNTAKAQSIIGDVKGKICIVLDDMIDTGGSVLAALQTLRKEGAHPDVYLAATHAIFSHPCVSRLKKAGFKEVVVTDSVPIPKEKRFSGLKVISVAPMMAEVIRRIHLRQSVTGIWS